MRRALPLALAAALTSCASTPKTRPLDRSRPLEIHESRWHGTTYEQGGERVEGAELLSALVATPEGREHVRVASREGTRAVGLLLLGTGLLVGVLTADDPNVQTGLSAGSLAAFGGTLYFSRRATAATAAAARAYNASLQAPPPAAGRTPSPRAPGPSLSLSIAF